MNLLEPARLPAPQGFRHLVRLVLVGWGLNLKLRSRSTFDGLLGIVWPLFFATTAYFLVRTGHGGQTLVFTAVGSSVLGVWSAVSTSASAALQHERRLGTLELLVAAPAPFAVVVAPIALSMATIGSYALVATLLYARFVFGVHIPVHDPALFGVSLVLTVVSVGMLGFLLSVAMVRYRSGWAVGNALEYPVWLAAGMLVPLSVLPSWVHPIAWLIGPTWSTEAVRAASLGTSGGWAAAGMCALLAVVYGVLGAIGARVLVRSARQHAALTLS